MADKSSGNPFMDMFQNFGNSMSIPGPDMNDMMEYHRKNLQALQAAAQVSSGSAQALMAKQREALEKAMADISSSVQSQSSGADTSKMMSAPMDLAKKTFDATLQTTQEMAEILRQGNVESFDVIKARVMESVDELSPKKKS
ncbi:Phasin family protein [Sulfitobacter noctilucicola]|uniref:Phasin family protein n=1 Tax=Sulfitobacter noctilucicola TaxID=1342301 RepID=A0A7W6MAH6_9RHOB|nr:TIGR01841 family phasin [Sulfitobacter noctilucicola]KIN63496.1 Phasin family protein [Sulfitobacter noctilucicola]MBB4174993.1 phasin family protein [Sulfitobacter noctilucicola]